MLVFLRLGLIISGVVTNAIDLLGTADRIESELDVSEVVELPQSVLPNRDPFWT